MFILKLKFERNLGKEKEELNSKLTDLTEMSFKWNVRRLRISNLFTTLSKIQAIYPSEREQILNN